MERSEAPSLSVVVPCYNEADNLPFIFSAFEKVLDILPTAEIILVNNGSTDNSQEVFEQLMASTTRSQFKIVKIDKNEGYGNGILEGLKNATSDFLCWTHADLQTDPLDVCRALDRMKEQPNLLMVKGKRKERRWSEAIFSFGMQVFASIILKARLNEINAQPKLFRRAFYEGVVVNAPKDFSLDLYFLYKALKQGDVEEIPVFFRKRIYGEAKGGGSFRSRIRLIIRTFKYIFELRRRL